MELSQGEREREKDRNGVRGRRDGMELNLIFYKSFMVPFSSYPSPRRISLHGIVNDAKLVGAPWWWFNGFKAKVAADPEAWLCACLLGWMDK